MAQHIRGEIIIQFTQKDFYDLCYEILLRASEVPCVLSTIKDIHNTIYSSRASSYIARTFSLQSSTNFCGASGVTYIPFSRIQFRTG